MLDQNKFFHFLFKKYRIRTLLFGLVPCVVILYVCFLSCAKFERGKQNEYIPMDYHTISIFLINYDAIAFRGITKFQGFKTADFDPRYIAVFETSEADFLNFVAKNKLEYCKKGSEKSNVFLKIKNAFLKSNLILPKYTSSDLFINDSQRTPAFIYIIAQKGNGKYKIWLYIQRI